MNSSDPFQINLVSGITLGEDIVYFSQNWIENGSYRSSVFSWDGTDARRVTFGGHERMPLYHDGSLYYISSDDSEESVLRLSGMGEPEVLCTFHSISSYTPYRNGVLAVVSENFKSSRPFIVTRLKYKHDTTGLLRRRRSLYFSSADSRRLVGGWNDIADVKTNGDRIIVSSSHVNDDYSLTDLYEVDFATGDMKKITRKQGSVDAFDISPSGRVAYIGHRSGVRDWATRMLFIVETGKAVEAGSTAGVFISTDMFDDSGPLLKWDSETLYTIGQTGGITSLYRYDGNDPIRISPEGISVRHFGVSDGKIAYSYSTPTDPSVLVFDGSTHDLNPLLSAYPVSSLSNGDVEGWAIITGRDNPNILYIHGGPHGSFGAVYYSEMQYFAQRGYNIIFCNPGGSMGYGEAYAGRSVGDWGGKDYEDIMGFLHHAVGSFGLTGKVGVKGISYGGYMVNWIVTQTDEFSAAISEKGVSNLLSSCGTSDIGYWFDAPEEIGTKDPWSEKSIDLFMKRSPITYVRNVRTPTMLIHGEIDHRCPIEQSEQFFTALKFYGTETVFVRLPGESHELENREDPVNRMETLKLKEEWFRKYLSADSTPVRKR